MFKKLIGALLAVVLLAGCTATSPRETDTSLATASVSAEASSEVSVEETQVPTPEPSPTQTAPEYPFVLPDYIAVQEDKAYDDDIVDYLPALDMVTLYQRPTAGEGQPTGYAFDITVSENEAKYIAEALSNTEEGAGAEQPISTIEGTYSYDPQTNCLLDSSNETPDVKQPYVGPVGQVTAATETLTIETLPNLFTVTSEGGVYPDCIGVRETTAGEGETPLEAVAFYAPGLGNVLRVVDHSGNQTDYQVTFILSRVDILPTQSEAPQEAPTEDVPVAAATEQAPAVQEPAVQEPVQEPQVEQPAVEPEPVYDDTPSYDDSYDDSYDYSYDDSYDYSYGSGHHGSGHHSEHH